MGIGYSHGFPDGMKPVTVPNSCSETGNPQVGQGSDWEGFGKAIVWSGGNQGSGWGGWVARVTSEGGGRLPEICGRIS